MENKRKRHQESGVQTTPSPSEIGLGDSEVLVTPQIQHKDKKLKKRKKVAATSQKDLDDDYKLKKHKKQKKLLDELSNRLEDMTEIVKKLHKNSDLLETSLKVNQTPEIKECCYESKDAFLQHEKTIFVFGFDCSFPRDDIRSALIKHFSSCGEIAALHIPFHCQTGSPLGFAFINLRQGEDKALTLNGSYLGGLRLKVTMAIQRSEYYGYTNRKGCERCRTILVNRKREEFYRRVRIPMTPDELLRFCPDKTKKQ